MEAIPTAVTQREIAELQHLARGKRVLEVGSLLGFSTIRLAQVAFEVHAVDPHDGYPSCAPKPTLSAYTDNLCRSGFAHKVVTHVGYDYRVLPHLRPGSFNLAFIDTTGLYTDTLLTMRLVIPLLTHYAVLAVHDCGHPDWPGATQAVWEFSRERNTMFRLVDRLAIFQQTWG